MDRDLGRVVLTLCAVWLIIGIVLHFMGAESEPLISRTVSLIVGACAVWGTMLVRGWIE